MYRFDLESAIAAWRHSLDLHPVFLEEDLDELEQHLRDHVEALTAAGVDVEAAYRAAAGRLGAHSELETAYRRVRFGRSKRRRALSNASAWGLIMLKNYLLIALRSLRRHKGYAAINVAGLAVGIACCLLIALYVADELAYDRFHAHAGRTYRLLIEPPPPDPPRANLPAATGARLVDRYADVQHMVRLFKHWEAPLIAGEQADGGALENAPAKGAFIEEAFYFADSTFFDIFSFELLQGTPETALDAPFSLVLTASAARRYFGDVDPVGRTLRYNTRHTFTVTGVLADAPRRSHLHPDFVASMASLPAVSYAGILEEWSVFYTYVVLAEGANPAAFADAATAFLARSEPAPVLRLQPLTDIHLHSHLADELEPNGDIRYVYLLSTLGLLILVIACINYMNLATARSMRRAREVGIRKAAGARRSQLVQQFYCESFLLALPALLLAMGLLWAARPLFEPLTGKALSLAPYTGYLALSSVVLLGLIGLLAGSYPALFLSRFRPAEVLKGTRTAGAGGRRLRKSLVVAQFAASVVLIVGTLVVFRQLGYVREARLGFDREHVLTIPVQDATLRGRYEALRATWLRDAAVRAVGATSSAYPGRNHSGNHRVRREGAAAAGTATLFRNWVDAAYLETLGIELAAGRGFTRDLATDAEAAVLNEAAVRALGWTAPEQALDRTLVVNPESGPETRRVVGVVKDYHFASMHHTIAPLILTPNDWPTNLLVRIDGNHIPETLARLRAAWATFSDQPFTYAFLDDQLDALYRADAQWGVVLGAASLLAVFVACLGLFGLAAFTAEQRTKEIGIRKVLGASVPGLVALLTRDVLKLVLAAFVVAVPLAYVAMDRWLETFAYRTPLGLDLFLLGGAGLLLVALGTVGYQSIRAARADPARSLRYE